MRTTYEPAHQLRLLAAVPLQMKPRIDILTASRVDLVLLLLPMSSKSEAFSLIHSGVPLEIAARVLDLPRERRLMPPAPAFPK